MHPRPSMMRRSDQSRTPSSPLPKVVSLVGSTGAGKTQVDPIQSDLTNMYGVGKSHLTRHLINLGTGTSTGGIAALAAADRSWKARRIGLLPIMTTSALSLSQGRPYGRLNLVRIGSHWAAPHGIQTKARSTSQVRTSTNGPVTMRRRLYRSHGIKDLLTGKYKALTTGEVHC